MYTSNIGECCGANIIVGFEGTPNRERVNRFNQRVGGHTIYPDRNVSLSCILTKTQLTRKSKEFNSWAHHLKKADFDLVAKWKNPNSSNTLFMFVLTKTNTKIQTGWWDSLETE